MRCELATQSRLFARSNQFIGRGAEKRSLASIAIALRKARAEAQYHTAGLHLELRRVRRRSMPRFERREQRESPAEGEKRGGEPGSLVRSAVRRSWDVCGYEGIVPQAQG